MHPKLLTPPKPFAHKQILSVLLASFFLLLSITLHAMTVETNEPITTDAQTLTVPRRTQSALTEAHLFGTPLVRLPTDPVYTIPYPSFPNIGIQGNQLIIGAIISHLDVLKGVDSSGRIDFSAPGYGLLTEINNGLYRGPEGFTALIQHGRINFFQYNGPIHKLANHRLGSAALINLDFTFKTDTHTNDSLFPITGFAHELVHAWRALSNRMIDTKHNHPLIREVLFYYEELSTVGGLIPYERYPTLTPPRYTENTFRAYFNLPPRTSYSGISYASINNRLHAVKRELEAANDLAGYISFRQFVMRLFEAQVNNP